MEQFTSQQSGPQQHWNDENLQEALPVLRPENFEFRYKHPEQLSSVRQQSYEDELTEQHGLVYLQRQALLELVDARLEGRESPVDEDEVAHLGISPKVINSVPNLVEELYGRMGPTSEMPRGDVMLTTLAGLLISDITERNKDVAAAMLAGGEIDDPLTRTISSISVFTEALRNNPELGAGIEKELLLAAEMMSDALHAPSGVMDKSTEGGLYEDKVRAVLWGSIVTLSETAYQAYSARYDKLENDTRKRAIQEREKIPKKMGRALATKYDALFDMMKPDDSPEKSEALLLEMTQELEVLAPNLDTGYLYELFTSLMVRYVAHSEGRLAQVHVWHATERADTPKDGIGNAPGKKDIDMRKVALHASRQLAQDVLVGEQADDMSATRISERWQLKARSDADNMSAEYDERFVKVRSEDAKKLIKAAEILIAKFDPELEGMTEIRQAVLLNKYNPKHLSLRDRVQIAATDVIVHDLLVGIVAEVAARLKGESLEHGHTVRIGSRLEEVDPAKILDAFVLPEYERLFKGDERRAAVLSNTVN